LKIFCAIASVFNSFSLYFQFKVIALETNSGMLLFVTFILKKIGRGRGSLKDREVEDIF